MHVQCENCLKLKEKEETSEKWSDEPEHPDLISETLKRLERIGIEDSIDVYQCPVCGQEYRHYSWNELFSDGWVEFSELRKIHK